MNCFKSFVVSCSLVAVVCFVSNAQEDMAPQPQTGTKIEVGSQSGGSDMKVSIHGWGSYEFGQIVSGHMSQDVQVEHVWRQRVYANLKADLRVNDRIHMIVAPEVLMFSRYPVYSALDFRQDIKAEYAVYLDETYFKYLLGNINQPWLAFKVGYFKFKYNPDVRDLGEYVFRGGTYPPYIHNNFDHAYQRLLGLNISSTLFDSLWHQDLVINSQTEYYPRDDYSLSYFTDLNLRGITLGGGINFDHLLSVDENLTTPKVNTNIYYHGVHSYDSTDPFMNIIRVTRYDKTLYYSFRGIKLMGRWTIDPKAFFPDVKIFGANDLRLYGEACVLGLKNIINEDVDPDPTKHAYEHLYQRIPWMVGFNVPTFKLLDVLGVEVQYWNNPFANDFNNVRRIYEPSHYNVNGWEDRKNQNLKWSIYAKKTFLDRFSIIMAFARDNLLDIDENNYTPLSDFEETYRYSGDWYWRFKLQADF
jgi:hypothetical protein